MDRRRKHNEETASGSDSDTTPPVSLSVSRHAPLSSPFAAALPAIPPLFSADARPFLSDVGVWKPPCVYLSVFIDLSSSGTSLPSFRESSSREQLDFVLPFFLDERACLCLVFCLSGKTILTAKERERETFVCSGSEEAARKDLPASAEGLDCLLLRSLLGLLPFPSDVDRSPNVLAQLPPRSYVRVAFTSLRVRKKRGEAFSVCVLISARV